MKHKITLKRLAVLMSIVITGSIMVAIPAVAEDEIPPVISQGSAFMPAAQTYWKYMEKDKFAAGEYWNKFAIDEDHTSEVPCPEKNHSSFENCYGADPGFVYSTGYNGRIMVGGYYQCIGFARKLATDFYSGCHVWIRHYYTPGFQFRFGDQVTISNDRTGNEHTVFITGVNGNTFQFADCNWDNHCGIRWDVSVSVVNNKLYLNGDAYSFAFIERPAMEGDVTGDSQIMVDDLMTIYFMALGTYEFQGSSTQMYAMQKAADLNCDGNVTLSDLDIALAQYDSSGYLRYQTFLSTI